MIFSFGFQGPDEFHDVIYNLDPTKDGEAGEKSHGAADEAKLGFKGHLHIAHNLVISGCVEVDLDQLQCSIVHSFSWVGKLI